MPDIAIHFPSIPAKMKHPPQKLMNATSQVIPDRHFDSLRGLESGYWWFLGRLHWVAGLFRLAQPRGAESYADIGCGTGGAAKSLAESLGFTDVTLVDGNAHALRYAAESSGFRIVTADITSNFKLARPVDALTCLDVFEHIPDDAALAKTLYDQLKPGGALVVTVPAFRSLFSDWDKHLGHLRRYSRREVTELLRGAGFEVVRTRYMWSFLFPLGPIRKWTAKKQEALEFPPVSPLVNGILFLLSRMEWQVARVAALPFGTSVIALARRPS